jgi:hypothetical protein
VKIADHVLLVSAGVSAASVPPRSPPMPAQTWSPSVTWTRRVRQAWPATTEPSPSPTGWRRFATPAWISSSCRRQTMSCPLSVSTPCRRVVTFCVKSHWAATVTKCPFRRRGGRRRPCVARRLQPPLSPGHRRIPRRPLAGSSRTAHQRAWPLRSRRPSRV